MWGLNLKPFIEQGCRLVNPFCPSLKHPLISISNYRMVLVRDMPGRNLHLKQLTEQVLPIVNSFCSLEKPLLRS